MARKVYRFKFNKLDVGDHFLVGKYSDKLAKKMGALKCQYSKKIFEDENGLFQKRFRQYSTDRKKLYIKRIDNEYI